MRRVEYRYWIQANDHGKPSEWMLHGRGFVVAEEEDRLLIEKPNRERIWVDKKNVIKETK